MAGIEQGGYEEGYRGSPCFWGTEPGSLVRALTAHTTVTSRKVADLGAGEGKNAYFLATQDADVTAVEVSGTAIVNGLRVFGHSARVRWLQADVTTFRILPEAFDVIICYGLLHCMPNESTIRSEIARYQAGTVAGGWHVLCAFNSRHQELTAHPDFKPTLLSHSTYSGLYSEWEVLVASDTDLTETHPHNLITHTHSMTRILARKPSNA